MKNLIIKILSYPMALMLAIALLMSINSCQYSRIGTLTVASTRNMDSHANYALLDKEVVGKARVKNHDAIEVAIDEAVAKFPTGEFMKNVRIYTNGKKIKVVGDVWGSESYIPAPVASAPVVKSLPAPKKDSIITSNVNPAFEIGGRVSWKNASKFNRTFSGTIIEKRDSYAVIKLDDGSIENVKYRYLIKSN